MDERDSILWPTCVLAFRLNSHTDNIFLNSPGRLAGKWTMLAVIAAVLVTVLAVALVMRNRKLARKRRSRCKFTYTLLLQCMNITNP